MKTEIESERTVRRWWEDEKGELSFPHHIREIEKALVSNNTPEVLFGFLLGDLGNLDYMAERYGSLAPAALHELKKSWQERFVQYIKQKPEVTAELGVKALESNRDGLTLHPHNRIGFILAYLRNPDKHSDALRDFSFRDTLEKIIVLGRMDESYRRYVRPIAPVLPEQEERRKSIEMFYRSQIGKIKSFDLVNEKYKDAQRLFDELGLIQTAN